MPPVKKTAGSLWAGSKASVLSYEQKKVGFSLLGSCSFFVENCGFQAFQGDSPEEKNSLTEFLLGTAA